MAERTATSPRKHLAVFHLTGRFGFINTNSVKGYEADLCAASLKQIENLRKRYWIYNSSVVELHSVPQTDRKPDAFWVSPPTRLHIQ